MQPPQSVCLQKKDLTARSATSPWISSNVSFKNLVPYAKSLEQLTDQGDIF